MTAYIQVFFAFKAHNELLRIFHTSGMHKISSEGSWTILRKEFDWLLQ
jgi:hypothetical protein